MARLGWHRQIQKLHLFAVALISSPARGFALFSLSRSLLPLLALRTLLSAPCSCSQPSAPCYSYSAFYLSPLCYDLPVTRRRNSNTLTAGLLTCSIRYAFPIAEREHAKREHTPNTTSGSVHLYSPNQPDNLRAN